MRRGKVFVFVLVILALVVTAPVAGNAGTSVGDFEIDGNTSDETGNTAIDWDTANAVSIADPDPATSVCPAGVDDSFGNGSKEEDPLSWDLICQPVPKKNDILGARVASRTIGAETFLYVAFTRVEGGGNWFAAFEFNKVRESFFNGIDDVQVRSNGDVAVFFFATNGGSVLNVNVAKWSGNNTAGSWVVQSELPGTNFDAATDAAATFAEAAVKLTGFGIQRSCPGFGAAWVRTISSQVFSSAEIKDRTDAHPVNLSNCGTKTFSFTFDPQPIAGAKLFAVYTPSDGNPRSLELTDPDGDGTFTGSDDRIPAGAFTSHFELRTNLDGNPDDENLVWRSADDNEVFAIDQTIHNTGSLHYEVLISPPPQENFAGRPHSLTATVREVGTGTPLVGVTVRFATENGTPAACGTLTPESGVTDANGHAGTTLTSATACSTGIRAWVDGTAGGAGFQTGEASATTSKTFVEYTILVTPPPQVNVVGTTHTFTVTLLRDTGSGGAGYAGQTLDLAISGTPGAHFSSVNGADASGTTATCTTRQDGTCEVVIVSLTTGAVSFVASYTTMNDSGQATFSSNGSKQYVDYRVSVSPPSASNEIGTPHTFTVLVEKDAGSGFAALAGQNVSLSLTQSGDAHLVSINGAPASGTSGSCETASDGTCAVVIVASTPGTSALTASIDVALDSGDLHREAAGSKLYSDFRLALTPPSAINEVGQPHTFTVALERNDGAGFAAMVGETVALTLSGGATDAHFTSVNGEDASGTSGSCTTLAGGTCTVVVVATTPGEVTLSAAWQGGNLTTGTAQRGATATKFYVLATNAKSSCPSDEQVVPPGAVVSYTLRITASGHDLHGATLVDTLPLYVQYLGSTGGAHSGSSPGGTVTWELGTLSSGADLTFAITGQVVTSTPLGTVVTNGSVFDADEIAPKQAESSLTISNSGAEATGRAFGLSASLLGGMLGQAATPETTSGPQEIGGVHDLAPTVDAGSLTVDNTPDVSSTGATDRAAATVASVSIDVAGHTIRARSVRAVSESATTGITASSSRSGSLIQDLAIDGATPVTVSEPKTITLKDATGAKVAEVFLLETTGSGAAGAVHQPAAGLFATGLIVNGIRVSVFDNPATPADEASQIVVAHADSRAGFPSALPCGGGVPKVVGRGYVLSLGDGVVAGEANLPSNGGSDEAAVEADAVLKASSARTTTTGTLDPLAALTRATVEDADLGGVITAGLIQATSQTDAGGPVGDTLIAGLVIDGTDVCATLGLPTPCRPAPGTVLVLDEGNVIVMLNEQLTDAAGLTVNAVHIWIAGRSNPFGLPAGAEIIIASALSGTGL